MTNKYQDFNFINTAIVEYCGEINRYECERTLTHSAWNILCKIDCPDEDIFETVIAGIRNVFIAGQDERDFRELMWED